jgi:DNA transformation protein
VDELLERLAGAGKVTARKMFGEYCVYLDGKPVALVCDNRLYLKPTDAGRELAPGTTEELPYPGAKPHLVISPDRWEDEQSLCRLVRATFEMLPRPRKSKRKPRPK